MPTAAKYSFTIIQGATLDINIEYRDASGSLVNLTNYGAKMQIRPNPGSSTLYITLSSSLQADRTGLNFSGSNNSTSPASGSIGLYISAASSSQLNFDLADYDLFIQSGSYADKLLEGRIRIDKRVTT
jgi:hypothetical protein